MIIRGRNLIVNLKIINIVNNKDEKSAATIIIAALLECYWKIKTLHKALVIRGPVLGGESSTR